MTIAIIDYGMGNLRSVKKALDRLNVMAVITHNPRDIQKSDKIILPGVGHFKQGMTNIRNLGLFEVLQAEVIDKKKPILGICLGMQLMAKHSEEGDMDGFGWIDTFVKKFDVSDTNIYKVPHMGWNTLNFKVEEPLLNKISFDDEFYFVHSFHCFNTVKEQILTTTNYSYDFVSAVKKDNIIGCQFHPEKSHSAGKQLLMNFIDY